MDVPGVRNIRLAVGPCRSGTTVFANMFGQIGPEVTVFLRPLESKWADIKGQGMSYFQPELQYDPDYRFFNQTLPQQKTRSSKTFVAVENICEPPSFEVFPNDETIKKTKPLFLFRDPIETWLSWKKNNIALRTDEKNIGESRFIDFLIAYRFVYGLCKRAKAVTADAMCLTSEQLNKNPKAVIESICKKWSIPFVPAMLSQKWRYPVDHNPNLVITENEQKLFDQDAVYLRTVRSKPGFEPGCVSNADITPNTSVAVTPKERELIELKLRPLFNELNILSKADFPVDDVTTPAKTIDVTATAKDKNTDKSLVA